MALLDIDFKPENKALRQFGFVALVAFGLLGGYVLWKGGLFGFDFGDAARPVAFAMFGLGAISGVLALVAPAANRPLYLALIVLTYPIGFVLSYLVMGIIYYLVITPLGLFFRLVRRDHLRLRIDPGATSYWVTRDNSGPIDKRRYFKQF